MLTFPGQEYETRDTARARALEVARSRGLWL